MSDTHAHYTIVWQQYLPRTRYWIKFRQTMRLTAGDCADFLLHLLFALFVAAILSMFPKCNPPSSFYLILTVYGTYIYVLRTLHLWI